MGRKLAIEDMKQLALERGGKCLSDKYINVDTKLKWQCKEGHIWEAIPYALQRGHWCPKCFGNAKLSIEEMQEIAKQRGGKCLSDKYANAHTKLTWQCKEGHVWDAVPMSLKKGYWCPKCGWKKTADSKRLNIQEMQDLAKSRGGICLSKEYVDSHSKLKWQCAEGHIWEAEPGNIKYGQWCRICKRRSAGINQRLTLEEMRKLADMKGGKCLSKIYIGIHSKLKWQCKEGHVWEATPSNLQRGTWCPKCSENISERICRKIFENIFNEKFSKRRPNWLLNPQNKKMELDGYCKKLRLAFEYQGVQHYKYVQKFHQTRSFERQKTMDDVKRKKCEENNVILIDVPYTIDYEKMPKYIIQECKKRNIKIPEITKSLDYKLMNIYSPEKLKELQEIAKEKGGLCLSTKYINNRTKLKWQCKEGHIWGAVPNSIKQNTWCPYCGGGLRLDIQQMQELAKKKGGVCLSKEYVNNRIKLIWRCKEGHIWKSAPYNIKDGRWCPYCAGVIKLTLEQMQDLAKKKGGKCLSEKYINGKTKLKWQCKEGHVWDAAPNHIKQGKWCPYCTHHIKLTIEQMRELAKKKGGMCLSKEYIDTDTKLTWQCKEGHTWNATPYHIKNRNSWCPKCGIMRTANLKRKTIEEMQELAQKKGGKCLSKNYVHTLSKLTWQCREGHIWQTTPHTIKHGSWCPICAKNRMRRPRKLNRNYKKFLHKHVF